MVSSHVTASAAYRPAGDPVLVHVPPPGARHTGLAVRGAAMTEH